MATALSLSLPRPPLLTASAPSSKSICARTIAAKFASPARESPFSHCPLLPFCRNSLLAGLYPSSLHLSRGKSAVARAVDHSEAPAAVRSDATPPKLPTIWMSDVVVQWKRPYFVNRPWTSQDVVNATFMLILHGLCLLAPFTFTWKAFGVFVLLYVITGLLGITLSFHRNLSHKSFKLPKYLEYAFAYCGVLAMQGDPLEWVSSHRYHHQHCDMDNDPHSPYEGFWYSHIGWLFDYTSTTKRVGARGNVGDMAKDPFYQFIQKTYIIHPLLLGVVLYALGGLPFFIWGMAVRTAWVYHITWFVNSAAHVWGSQAWNTGDLSRNNWWVALLAFGEGWHNNHHAFEYSARHGLEWWQLDLTWYCVLALEKVGLATKVKLPTREHMAHLAL